MTRVRKIGPSTAVPPPKQRRRRAGAARILRGTDGRPVRARRLNDSPSLRLRLLRFSSVVLLFGFFAVLWTRPVRHVEIQGQWLSSGDFVSSMFRDEIGRRWVTTPTRHLEEQLMRDPWIEEVQVLRAPGARIVVRIREAEPVFCARLDGIQRVVDRFGNILPASEGLLVDALPILDGLQMQGGELAPADRESLCALVLALESSGWVWSEGLERVDIEDPDEVLLQSRDGVEVVIRLTEASEQLAAAAAVWHELDIRGPSRVDLRFEDQIVLRH